MGNWVQRVTIVLDVNDAPRLKIEGVPQLTTGN